MPHHFDLSDDDFLKAFENASLEPAVFSHEAHLRLAWIHIRYYGLEEAEQNIVRQLKNFVSELGAEEKYHHTLTIAAVHAVHHFMEKSEHNNFKDFIEANPELKSHFKELIHSHYSFDIFESDEARKKFIDGDKQAFKSKA